MAKVLTTVDVAIDAERKYSIEDVKFLTGYATGYLRDLERAGKIPKAQRDEKNWRFWMGKDILEIMKYKPSCGQGMKNLNKKKKAKAKVLA